jgi:hypothetical protein
VHRAEVKEGTNVSMLMYVGVCVGKVHPFCFQTGHPSWGYFVEPCLLRSIPYGRGGRVTLAPWGRLLLEGLSAMLVTPMSWRSRHRSPPTPMQARGPAGAINRLEAMWQQLTRLPAAAATLRRPPAR